MAKIINREQLEENWKSQQELVRWIYPDYLSGEEWEKFRKEYLKWLDTEFCSLTAKNRENEE
mgnify:CR=1 FL=1